MYSNVFQHIDLNQPIEQPYLTRSQVREMVWVLAGRKIGQSSFYNWREMLGEREEGTRKDCHSNLLLAKFVLFAELMKWIGATEPALDRFWETIEQHRNENTIEDFVNATLSRRKASQKQPQVIFKKDDLWSEPASNRTVCVSAVAVRV